MVKGTLSKDSLQFRNQKKPKKFTIPQHKKLAHKRSRETILCLALLIALVGLSILAFFSQTTKQTKKPEEVKKNEEKSHTNNVSDTVFEQTIQAHSDRTTFLHHYLTQFLMRLEPGSPRALLAGIQNAMAFNDFETAYTYALQV